MRRLDYLKEKIGYRKFWQSIVVVTDISMAGWFVAAADEAGTFRVILAVLGIMLLTFGALVLHRQIAAYSEEIGKL
jgi:hypothetical protein